MMTARALSMKTMLTTSRVACAALALSIGGVAAGHAAEGVLSKIAACKAIADDRQRLQCLDEAIADVEVAKAAPAAKSVMEREQELAQREGDLKRREAVLQAKSEAVEKSGSLFGITFSSGGADSFTTAAAGMPQQQVERGSDGDVEAISATVRTWSYDGQGQITIVLDNGQTWRQADSSEIHLAPRSKPHRVRISRAMLGSFTMTIDDRNKGYKVRRVKPTAG
jgi:hypothetical protein